MANEPVCGILKLLHGKLPEGVFHSTIQYLGMEGQPMIRPHVLQYKSGGTPIAIVTLLLLVTMQTSQSDIDNVIEKNATYHSSNTTYRYLIKGERILQARSIVNMQDIDPSSKHPRRIPSNDIECHINRELRLNFAKECLWQSINDEEPKLPKGGKYTIKCLTAHNGQDATYLNTNAITGQISKSGITDYSIQKGPGIGYAYFDEAALPVLFAHGIMCANNTIPTNGRMKVKVESAHFTIIHTEKVNNNQLTILRTVGERKPHDYWCSAEFDFLPTKVIEYHNARTMKKLNEYNMNYVKRNGEILLDSWTVETFGADGIMTHLGHFQVIDQSKSQDIDMEQFFIKHQPGMSVATRKQASKIQDNAPSNADFYLADGNNRLVPVASVAPVPYLLILSIAILICVLIAVLRYRKLKLKATPARP